MRPIIHAKTDSDVTTSVDGASPPRRPMYYVESPSAEMEKLSLNSSPVYSPPVPIHHQHYRGSPIHHSRESSTSRFSYASLKQSYANSGGWWPMRRAAVGVETKEVEDDGDMFVDDDFERDPNRKVRIACLVVFGFVIVLSILSLILWGSSKSYLPRVAVQNVVFQSFDVQAGVDDTGVATEMLSLNSSVMINYVNGGTFFGVHVSSTPWELYCYQLVVASGEMEKFYEGRKSQRTVVTLVQGHQVPVYGAVTAIKGVIRGKDEFVLPLNLTLSVHSEAYILGKLVRSNFHNQVRCPVTLRRNQLGKKLKVTDCFYQ